MPVGQKLAMLKIRSKSVTFLSLCDLEAALEEALQLRRLIKSSNESLGPYMFGKIEFWNFQGPRAEIPGGDSTSKSPGLIGLRITCHVLGDKGQKKLAMASPQTPQARTLKKKPKLKKNTTGKRPISPFYHEFYEVRHNNDDSSHIYKGQLR